MHLPKAETKQLRIRTGSEYMSYLKGIRASLAISNKAAEQVVVSLREVVKQYRAIVNQRIKLQSYRTIFPSWPDEIYFYDTEEQIKTKLIEQLYTMIKNIEDNSFSTDLRNVDEYTLSQITKEGFNGERINEASTQPIGG